MTTVFSAIAMPKGGSFLRRPDFFKSRTAAGDVIEPPLKPFDPAEVDIQAADSEEADLTDMNSAMSALVDVFPDVEPEVFREMLVNLSEQSRLEVVTEHLLRDGTRYVQGRYRKHNKDDPKSLRTSIDSQERPTLSKEEGFRSDDYKKAVKAAFYQEFRSLSHSTIKAVLAEHNYSYTRARPTLQQLASRSWRFSISSLWPRKRTATTELNEHPLIEWQPDLTGSGMMLPCLKRTKSSELNREIYDTLVAPVLARQKEQQQQRDFALAVELNETEAEQAEAMYDCECCYSSVTFEQISTCDDACHYICFQCIRFATNEALYGQGWARNIDFAKSTVRCLAPSLKECSGCIPPEMVQRALSTDKDGRQIWHKLEQRVASECLIKSQLPLLRCPFCPYAELDELPHLQFRDPMTVAIHLAYLQHEPIVALGLLVLIFVYPFLYLLLPFLFTLIAAVHKPVDAQLQASRTRVVRRRRGLKFICRSPTCGRKSCTSCSAPWKEAHKCHEASLLSLRHAIEAATTSSIKRTCPKCHLSFVKSSGCNKLVCNCGYTMCYVCRNEIGREGYGHFCQHFRERGGRCAECDRCDLYIVEDEEGVIKRAAEDAEKAWLANEGVQAMGKKINVRLDQFGSVRQEVIAGTEPGKSWNVNALVDAFFDVVMV